MTKSMQASQKPLSPTLTARLLPIMRFHVPANCQALWRCARSTTSCTRSFQGRLCGALRCQPRRLPRRAYQQGAPSPSAAPRERSPAAAAQKLPEKYSVANGAHLVEVRKALRKVQRNLHALPPGQSACCANCPGALVSMRPFLPAQG